METKILVRSLSTENEASFSIHLLLFVVSFLKLFQFIGVSKRILVGFPEIESSFEKTKKLAALSVPSNAESMTISSPIIQFGIPWVNGLV